MPWGRLWGWNSASLRAWWQAAGQPRPINNTKPEVPGKTTSCSTLKGNRWVLHLLSWRNRERALYRNGGICIQPAEKTSGRGPKESKASLPFAPAGALQAGQSRPLLLAEDWFRLPDFYCR